MPKYIFLCKVIKAVWWTDLKRILDNFTFDTIGSKPEDEFKFRLKYGWFQVKLYLMFQDKSQHSLKPVFGGFEGRLKFIRFGHRSSKNAVYSIVVYSCGERFWFLEELD